MKLLNFKLFANITKLVVFGVLGLYATANFAIAATNDFTVRALVGEDLVPPTTPVLVSVDPVAPTQIDIVWGPSTDNVLLGGYVLLRDGTPVATTTLTTYIDTDLVPETLYAYEVFAFDAFNNISSTSNSLATTTPAIYVPPVVTENDTVESTLVFKLLNLDIETQTNKTFFDWKTSIPSQFLLRWGKSDSYDAGYISGNTFRTNHKTVIDNLEPGSTYLYELVGYSSKGTVLTLKKGEFKTLGLELISPSNVSNLTAEVKNKDVRLSWLASLNAGDAKVRIVRSHLGYPNNINDGAVVYEGNDDNYTDVNAFVEYGLQYYTVFVITEDGSVSSGATIKVFETMDDKEGSEDIFLEPEITLPEYDFDISNIKIYQDGKDFDFKSEKIDLIASRSFLLSIPYDSLPKNLKSIVVTLVDPTDSKQAYSFLLRINKDGTAYEAVIAALNLTGASRLQIEVFDYERNIAARYRKPVNFIWSKENPEVVFPDVIVDDYFLTLYKLFIGLVTLTLILFVIYKRRFKTEDNR